MRRLLPLALLVALAAACSGPDARATDEGARRRVAAFRCPDEGGMLAPVSRPGRRLRVVTTVAPITSIVADVAGPAAEVRGLVPEGRDSHSFEPRPSAAAVLAEADVVIVNGLGLEEPVRRLARRRLRPDAHLLELGRTVLRPDAYLYDRSFPRAAGRPNPHLWTNPPMARCYAEVVARALASADPANADTYRANARRSAARFDALDDAMRTATATVPRAHRALLTYHDAFAYFAANYGWRVLGAIQVDDFTEPTPREVARLVDQVEAEGVPAIFGSEVFPSAVLERIGDEAGVRYVDVLRDDDLPGSPGDPEHSLLGLLRFDFVTIVRSLGGDPAALERLAVDDVGPAVYPQ